MKLMRTLPLLPLALLAFTLTAQAQDQNKTDKPADDPKPVKDNRPFTDVNKGVQYWEDQLHTTDCSKMPNRSITVDCAQVHFTTKTVFLKNVRQQNDANEILVAVRNMADPAVKIYLTSSQNAITIGSYPEEIARVVALIDTLDRPRPTYHVTFTIVDSDAGKRDGIQHFTLTVVDGQRTSLKEGSKVPVSTGMYSSAGNTSQEQMTYLDVGMSFDVTLNQVGPQVQLKTKVEESSVADMKTSFGDKDPVVRQTVIDGIATLTPGKPATIGSLDIPGTTRHVDVEALAEVVP